MKRKASLAALASVMALGTVVGCSSSTTKTGSDATPAPSAAPAGPTKFSISMRTLAVPYVEKHTDINSDKWVKELEKKTNIDLDIQLVPHKEYEQKMIQMFATNAIPDVVQANGGLNGKELAGSVQAGVFMSLNDLLNKYGQNLLKKIPKASWDDVTDKASGKIYAIPEWLGNPSRRATWIRTDLLEKTGLKEPKTVEEFLEVLRAFKKLGVEHPYAGRENFKYSDTFFGAYDVFPYLNQFENVNGTVQPKFMDNENMMKALNVYKTMVDEGLMSKEFATINPTTFTNNIQSGKAGIWSMNALELPIWEEKLKASVPTAKIKIIPSPIGTDGKGGLYMYNQNIRGYFLNAKLKQEQAIGIIKFFDWMVTDEAAQFFSLGVPNANTAELADELRYLSGWLWMVKDDTYNKLQAEKTETGKAMVQAFENVLSKEGRDGINFEPRLDSLAKNPDVSPLSDQAPPILLAHMVKMVMGKEPISDWPKAVEEWKSKGGNDVLKEATDKFNKKEGFTLPRR